MVFIGISRSKGEMMDNILDYHGCDENGGKSDARRREQKRKAGTSVAGTRLIREWNGRTYEVIA